MPARKTKTSEEILKKLPELIRRMTHSDRDCLGYFLNICLQEGNSMRYLKR